MLFLNFYIFFFEQSFNGLIPGVHRFATRASRGPRMARSDINAFSTILRSRVSGHPLIIFNYFWSSQLLLKVWISWNQWFWRILRFLLMISQRALWSLWIFQFLDVRILRFRATVLGLWAFWFAFICISWYTLFAKADVRFIFLVLDRVLILDSFQHSELIQQHFLLHLDLIAKSMLIKSIDFCLFALLRRRNSSTFGCAHSSTRVIHLLFDLLHLASAWASRAAGRVSLDLSLWVSHNDALRPLRVH